MSGAAGIPTVHGGEEVNRSQKSASSEGVEARLGLLVGVEQQLADDRGLPRAVGPEGEGDDVVGGQAQHQVGVDQLALVAGALVVVQARERRPVALAGGGEGPGALAVGGCPGPSPARPRRV
jgi:hypothetical protein